MSDVVHIESLGHGGEGLCRVEGAVVLVPGALPGDRVRLGALEKRRGVQWADAAELVERSPYRTEAACPVFGRCGGCDWLNFAYPAQGDWKQRIVEEAFRRIGRLEVETGWKEVPELRTSYRTRATFHSSSDGWGFYARGSHEVVPLETCPLAHERLNAAFQTLREVRGGSDVTITVNPEGDDVLVWTDRDEPEVRRVFPSAQSEAIGGTRTQFLFDGVPVVNGTFSQSSLLLNRLLREVADGFIGEPGSFLDLYCGSGNFSLGYADRCEVAGVDSSGPAVMAALRVSGADYRIGAPKQMIELIHSRAWDVVLLDPPRGGASKVASALGRARCNHVVYVSCDAATLARDSRALTAAGWTLQEAVVVDMFPNTPHIETVCRFTR